MWRRRVDQQAARGADRAGLAVDLFGRPDQEAPGEGREPPPADPLPGGRRAQHHPALGRRDEQGCVRADRGELLVAQQLRELRHRIGPARAERGAVEPRPDAAPVGHDDQQPAAAGQNAPDLLQHGADLLAALQRMDQQDPVDRIIGEGQFALVGEGHQVAPLGRPAQHPEQGRHQGERPLGVRRQRGQERGRIADADEAHPMEIRPYPLDRAADHAAGDLAEPAAVEISEIDDIRRHRGSLARRPRCRRTRPSASTPRSLALSAAKCYFLHDQGFGRREMDFGAAMFFTDYSMAPAELGRALEARGFESMWAPEHSHIPLSRKTPFPSGGELPKQYYDAMDPFVTLTAAAAATRTLKLGTGVCLVIQRDTIQTAKLVASLDQVSGGRFLFGIGGGWTAEEMEDHGTVYSTRFKKMREQIEAMQAIWTEPKPEYHGELVDFPPMMTWPKPVQRPHPPVIVGGAFPHAARRALRYGDGWIPHSRRPQHEDVTDFLPQFRQMAAEIGRDPAQVA